MERPKISVVIIGKNAEYHVRECLQSAHGWADEIVFVDDQSSDSTVEIARGYTSSIYTRKMEQEGRQRNFGAMKAQNDWIMILDCDERATPEVKAEIDSLFSARKDNEIAYWIPRKNYLGDHWLQWGGWYPAPHIKLYNRNYLRWKEAAYDVVHPGVEFSKGYTAGPNLKSHLIHYNYRNIEDFIAKTNRLTTLDAIKWYLDGRKMPMTKGLYRFFDRFFRRYIGKKGYRDGFYGFMASFLSGFYELAAYAKYREIIRKGYYLKEHNIEPKNRLPGCGRKRMKEIDKISGHFGLNEGYLVFNIAKSLKDNSVVLEIGAFKGKSTCFIAEGIRAKNCKFYTIDPWSNHGMDGGNRDIFNDFLKNTEFYKHKITPLKGYSHDMRKNWPEDRKIDFLWIDGDHSYKGVTQDIQDWLPLVKKNGFVCFHDYRDEPDVKRAVDELTKNKTIRFIKTEGCIYMARLN